VTSVGIESFPYAELPARFMQRLDAPAGAALHQVFH
jgi:hypothetical protein